MMNAQEALDKAKIQLMTKADLVFFTNVCFSLICRWNSDIPTACTDGKEIHFNPDFFMSLSSDEQIFLVLHETLHVVFMHMLRIQSRNPQKWNMAADYVINDTLIQRGYKMPVGGLYSPDYTNMSTEEIYAILPEAPNDYVMDVIPAPEGTDELQRDLDDILVRSLTQTRMQTEASPGIPGEVQIYLDSLLSPKLPWFQILRRFFNKTVKSNYTFRKPNRRYFPKYILPTQYSEAVVDIAIAVDTSGSVTDAQFHHFMSEVHGIMKQLRPTNLTLLQFDTTIKSSTNVTNYSDLAEITFTGRGGTRIDPVMKWATENKPNVLVIFTDGYFKHASINPAIQIVWIIHSNPNFAPDFGKTIQYTFNEET